MGTVMRKHPYFSLFLASVALSVPWAALKTPMTPYTLAVGAIGAALIPWLAGSFVIRTSGNLFWGLMVAVCFAIGAYAGAVGTVGA